MPLTRTRWARALIVAAIVGCGGARPAPAPPPPPPAFDAPALAAELDAELAALAAILGAHRDDCPRLAEELRALFERMSVTIDAARAAQADPEHARALTTAMHAYDDAAAHHTATIDAAFTTGSRCTRDRAVQDVLRSMPTL